MAGLPRDVRAWACGFCGKLAPRNKHGKELARVCCLCTECKKNAARRTGLGQRCDQCCAKYELASAEENMKFAQERLERARASASGVRPQR